MKDYSQQGEQAVILESFGDVPGAEGFRSGAFLDIGAWHPTEFSNTRALYELGWRGVMIEPSPACMGNLIDAYGNEERITLIQAAVTSEPQAGLMRLHISDDAVSTSDESHYELWKSRGQFRGAIWVPSLTLADIANRYGGFDFVNIDVEGKSADLFIEMLRLGIFPPCVCVEHDSREREILAAATAEHYACVLANGTNMVLKR